MSYKAYVGSYTFKGNAKGIFAYDVDEKNGRFIPLQETAVDNCSYLIASKDNKFLYAAVDQGIAAFAIEKDGSLRPLGTSTIRGMRGCYMDIHPSGHFIAISGYHDGKVTVLRLKDDGSVGDITAEFYDKGVGSIAERNFRPHISCVSFTADGKYLFAVDSGIDQIRIFSFKGLTGKISMRDILHCEMNSAPHRLLFSEDGRFLYVLHELKNYIAIYSYKDGKNTPVLDMLQTLPTLPKDYTVPSAACSLCFTPDKKHLICSNAGENTIADFIIDRESGLLTLQRILPISGDYPKDIDVFPQGNFLVSANHDSNSLTFFRFEEKNGTIIMNGRSVPVDSPNSIIFVKAE